jgi:gliding motility-associated-like protein
MKKQKPNTDQLLWKKLIVYFSILAVALLFANTAKAQDPPQYGTPFTGVPDIRDVNLYQVHNRPYSAAGNFAGIIARLDSIKALGTNVVYVMPIYPHGTDSRSSASPYSIKGFDSVATEYGTLTDFRNLVAGCHTRGMAVILDFAVNGTSWDHPWITQNPSWYVQSGGVIQQLANFSDVAALDFTNTAMRAAMVQSMRYWIFAANIDGFRCDFANNPPIDFWTNTIANLRGITTHNLIMLAEGDRQANYQAGFDYDFGDDFYYDALTQIVSGASVSTIQTTTNTEYTDATGSQQMARYTSNHDIETTTTAIQEFGGHNGVIANYLVCAYMRGVPFLTSGQEVDFNQTIPWPYTTVKINWSANLGASADFKKVNNYRTSSEAVRRGVMANFSDNNTCAFTKTSQTTSEKVVVMVNMRNSAQNYVIPAAIAGNYKDAYTGASVTLTSGATQSLTAFQYIVLTNQNVATVAVTGVSVSPTTASIAAGLTQQLTAAVAPSNASNQNVTWSSSNTAVATVNAAGLVTAVAAGTATITVTTQDGAKTATCAVTVTAASHFAVNFYRPSTWGTGIDIYWWSALPAGVLADGTWPGVAMTNSGNNWYSYTFTNVTSTNVIFDDGSNQTANLNRGSNGWYYNGNWYNTQPVPVTGVTVSPTSASLAVNATQQLTATLVPSNATVTGVTWASSNTAVATVSTSGLVTAVAAGTATITATTNDNSFTATSAITVNTTNAPVTGVTMNPTTASVSVGGTQQLTATVAPGNATNKTVSWSSSNTAIATVNTSGLVTAVAAGTATITVTTQDGSKTATCAVTVTTVAVTGVTMSPTSTSLSVGATQQLTATIAPSNATNKAVTWSSSNTAIATVSTAGLVTAVAAGTATITVKTTDGAKTATCAVTVTATSGFTVYFYRPSTWGTGIKIYWWSALPAGNLADGTWPGVNMTNTSGNWYSYTFTNITSTNLIFNDGSNQTANLNRGSNGWYYNGNWYNTQPVPVTGVTVSPTTATVASRATTQLTATLAPTNATVTGVSWSSNNTAVATVNATGLVTAVAAGTATITVTTTDNSFTANCTVTVTASGSTTYYNILNRWQPNTYLYDAGNGQVKYGTSPSGNNNYLWEQVTGPAGDIYLVNRGTGNMMDVEDQNGSIEANTGNSTWYSAMWSVVSTGDGWNYVENRWQTADWINIQSLAGYAQYSGASSGFYSAEWQFVNPTVVNNDAYIAGISGETNPAELNGLSGGPASAEPYVHAALSPNGDGINDVLTIDNISRYPENKITVMNARGVTVFETANYDNLSKTFDGHSSLNGAMMPQGTYFYLLEYKAGSTIKYKKGYIILKY